MLGQPDPQDPPVRTVRPALDELVALHAALDVLKGHGHPFAVSAVASAPVPRDAVVLTLPPVREN